MPFDPHPCDDPNHSNTVGPVDMVVLANRTVIKIHAYPYWACPKYLIAPVWCQQISMKCWDVGEEAYSVPGCMGVVVHVVDN